VRLAVEDRSGIRRRARRCSISSTRFAVEGARPAPVSASIARHLVDLRRPDLGEDAPTAARLSCCCPPRAGRPNDGLARLPRRPPGRTLVLVVDDEADLLQIVSDRLAAAGYRVLTARDGIEALARAREARPGCIILDLKMPRLGGFEALPEIRQAAPQARVIVLTGSPNRPLREACRARGADDFMLKPFDPGELLRLTAQAFRRD
jgi:CheY-like chemotaxis protein